MNTWQKHLKKPYPYNVFQFKGCGEKEERLTYWVVISFGENSNIYWRVADYDLTTA